MARTVTAPPDSRCAFESCVRGGLNQPRGVRPNHIRTRAIVGLSQRGTSDSPARTGRAVAMDDERHSVYASTSIGGNGTPPPERKSHEGWEPWHFA